MTRTSARNHPWRARESSAGPALTVPLRVVLAEACYGSHRGFHQDRAT